MPPSGVPVRSRPDREPIPGPRRRRASAGQPAMCRVARRTAASDLLSVRREHPHRTRLHDHGRRRIHRRDGFRRRSLRREDDRDDGDEGRDATTRMIRRRKGASSANWLNSLYRRRRSPRLTIRRSCDSWRVASRDRAVVRRSPLRILLRVTSHLADGCVARNRRRRPRHVMSDAKHRCRPPSFHA